MSIVYDYNVKSWDDKFVQVAENMNALGSRTLMPTSLLVNMLPFRTFDILLSSPFFA
jgi:hypothetical protein